jgi:hypothetical protein
MFSYDPISPDAKRLTGAGLTVLFDQGFLGAKPVKVLATGVPAQGLLMRGKEKDLGPGGLGGMDGVDADASLYEIDPKAEQGKIYIRAFCPGATRLWLSSAPSPPAATCGSRRSATTRRSRARRASAARWTSRIAASGSCPRAPARSDGGLDRQPDRTSN